jgi:superfamily II DNA helicase RecQ
MVLCLAYKAMEQNEIPFIEKEQEIKVCELKGLEKEVLEFIKILNIHKNEQNIKILNIESEIKNIKNYNQDFILSYVDDAISSSSKKLIIDIINHKLEFYLLNVKHTHKTLESKTDKLINNLQQKLVKNEQEIVKNKTEFYNITNTLLNTLDKNERNNLFFFLLFLFFQIFLNIYLLN